MASVPQLKVLEYELREPSDEESAVVLRYEPIECRDGPFAWFVCERTTPAGAYLCGDATDPPGWYWDWSGRDALEFATPTEALAAWEQFSAWEKLSLLNKQEKPHGILV